MSHPLQTLFARDLDRLQAEIEAFPTETSLWEVNGSVTNSPGNLVLHLLGNLQHFIGATLGGTGYVRDRPYEFSGKNIPRKDLIRDLKQTGEIVAKIIESLDSPRLNEAYPLQVFGKEMTVEYFLIHLQGHLNYHLGQINYFRRAILE